MGRHLTGWYACRPAIEPTDCTKVIWILPWLMMKSVGWTEYLQFSFTSRPTLWDHPVDLAVVSSQWLSEWANSDFNSSLDTDSRDGIYRIDIDIICMLLWVGLLRPSVGHLANLGWLSCHMKQYTPCGCSTCLNIFNQIYTNNIQFLVPSEIFMTAENTTKSIETAKSQRIPFLGLNMLIFTVITFPQIGGSINTP